MGAPDGAPMARARLTLEGNRTGCGTPSLVMVIIVRLMSGPAELQHWLSYHAALGVRDFIVVSNHCDDASHAAMLGAVRGVSCSPTVMLLDGFRCANAFQTSAYRAAVDLLLSKRRDLVPCRTRVSFTDLDEYLVVGGGVIANTQSGDRPVDAMMRLGVDTAPMWLVEETLHGSSLRASQPNGFVPANFVMVPPWNLP